METNRRYTNDRRDDEAYRDHGSHHYRRVDENTYRGAYRFDNESNHQDETTYDGFDLNDSMVRHSERDTYRQPFNYHKPDNYSAEQHQGGDYVYRRSQNAEDNNRRYRQQDYRSSEPTYRQRDHGYTKGYYKDRYGDADSNFNNSYAPDPYRNQNEDQNYGNMSGSLSFGYDGDYNSDPDYRRRYDPMSGKIRKDRDDDHRNRYPKHYGPPDRFGINPDYDRY